MNTRVHLLHLFSLQRQALDCLDLLANSDSAEGKRNAIAEIAKAQENLRAEAKALEDDNAG
jgi:hypothetical protein